MRVDVRRDEIVSIAVGRDVAGREARPDDERTIRRATRVGAMRDEERGCAVDVRLLLVVVRRAADFDVPFRPVERGSGEVVEEGDIRRGRRGRGPPRAAEGDQREEDREARLDLVTGL
jgi:hypothetical protein